MRILELPRFVVPVAGLALGWPADPDRAVTPRLPFDVSVHNDAYDTSFDAAFESYEELRDEREQRPDAEPRDVELFGVSPRPYGWAEDRTRQYSVPRRDDWGAHVRSQGSGLE